MLARPHDDREPSVAGRSGRTGTRAAAPVAAIVLLMLAVAGCGGPRNFPGSKDEPKETPQAQAAAPVATATPAPAEATTPATTAGDLPANDPALGRGRTLGGVTWTPLAVYAGPVQVSVRSGFLALAAPSADGKTSELRVAPNGGLPAAAPGASPMPAWAHPHVGSDAKGRVVVVYPVCTDPAQLGTCDLAAWTAATGRETKVRGTASANLAETEGVMDHGAVVAVREKRPDFTSDEFMTSPPSLTTLLYVPAGEKVRVLTRHGGRDLDLRGGRIAEVFTDPAINAESNPCGTTAVRVLDLTGLTTAERTVVCTTQQTRAIGPTLTGTSVRFAVRALTGERLAYQYDLTSGLSQSARITQPFDAWVLDGGTSGYVTRSVTGARDCGQRDPKVAVPRCRLSQFSGLTWKPANVGWNIGVGDTPVKQ